MTNNDSWSEATKLMRDYEYEMIAMGREYAVEVLDRWLERWLWAKHSCPKCGTVDELGEHDLSRGAHD